MCCFCTLHKCECVHIDPPHHHLRCHQCISVYLHVAGMFVFEPQIEQYKSRINRWSPWSSETSCVSWSLTSLYLLLVLPSLFLPILLRSLRHFSACILFCPPSSSSSFFSLFSISNRPFVFRPSSPHLLDLSIHPLPFFIFISSLLPPFISHCLLSRAWIPYEQHPPTLLRSLPALR